MGFRIVDSGIDHLSILARLRTSTVTWILSGTCSISRYESSSRLVENFGWKFPNETCDEIPQKMLK